MTRYLPSRTSWMWEKLRKYKIPKTFHFNTLFFPPRLRSSTRTFPRWSTRSTSSPTRLSTIYQEVGLVTMVMTILIKTLIMMTVMVVSVMIPSFQATCFIQETCIFENTNTNTNMKHETPYRRPEVQINEEARRQNPHRHSSSKGIIQILLSLAFYFLWKSL